MFNNIKNAHLEPLDSNETSVTVQTGKKSTLNVVLDNHGYKMPSEDAPLTATNVSWEDYERDSDTVATFSLIPNGEGDVTISGDCIAKDYPVYYTFNNYCTSSDSADHPRMDKNESVTITIVANEGYRMPTSSEALNNFSKYFSSQNVTLNYSGYTLVSTSTARLTFSNPTMMAQIQVKNLPVKVGSSVTITAEIDSQPLQVYTFDASGVKSDVKIITAGNSTSFSNATSVYVTGVYAARSTNFKSFYYRNVTAGMGDIPVSSGVAGYTWNWSITQDSTATIYVPLLPEKIPDIKQYDWIRSNTVYSDSTATGATVDTGLVPYQNLTFNCKYQLVNKDWADHGFGNIFGSRLQGNDKEYQLTAYSNGSIGFGTRNTGISQIASTEIRRVVAENYNGGNTAVIYWIYDANDDLLTMMSKSATIDFTGNNSSIILFGIYQQNESMIKQKQDSKIYFAKFSLRTDLNALSSGTNARYLVPITYTEGTTSGKKAMFDIFNGEIHAITDSTYATMGNDSDKTITLINSTSSKASISISVTKTTGKTTTATLYIGGKKEFYDVASVTLSTSGVTNYMQAGTGNFSNSDMWGSSKTFSIDKYSTAVILNT